MTKDELTSLVSQIVEDHDSDKDGGYYLVAAISDLYARLGETDQTQVREFLLEKVVHQDPELWGVGLEFLTRQGDQKIAQRLEPLARSTPDAGFKQQLIRALLRMQHEALDLYLPHIQSLIARDEPVCAELAHLYRVSPDSSLSMSASFFVKELSAIDGVRRTEFCIPVFVHRYPISDESSLARLVSETRKLNPQAAAELRRIIVDYLDKPWVVKDLGTDKRNRVLAQLNS